jgi:hypothetical protein
VKNVSAPSNAHVNAPASSGWLAIRMSPFTQHAYTNGNNAAEHRDYAPNFAASSISEILTNEFPLFENPLRLWRFRGS